MITRAQLAYFPGWQWGGRPCQMFRVGVRAAGRLLDGEEYLPPPPMPKVTP